MEKQCLKSTRIYSVKTATNVSPLVQPAVKSADCIQHYMYYDTL